MIALNYPNPKTIHEYCAGISDVDCYGQVREEIITGQDKSDKVTIDVNNSIEGRLLALLKYLNYHKPTAGWGQYYNSAGIIWSKISVSGISQGGGHAAYIGKLYQVDRVSMYSAISDYVTISSAYPAWFSMSSATPASKFYGFNHSPDAITNISGNSNQAFDAWNNLFLMSGPLTDVDGSIAPYGNSHQLITSIFTGASYTDLQRHCITAYSTSFEPVWDYISFTD